MLQSTFFVLFLVVAVGVALGAVRIGRVTLGSGAVFFVALAVGIINQQSSLKIAAVPHELTEFGLLLFVYSVGLQAGPRFFGILRTRAGAFLAVGGGATLCGALAAVGLALWFHYEPALAAGLYTGATTCTPALAAVLDVIRRNAGDVGSVASVGYGAAYPFTVVAVVATVQLLPWLLRRSAGAAAEQFRAEQAAKTPALVECAFRVTNRNCAGRTIDEFQGLHVTQAVLCRIRHEGEIRPARPETTLALGDTVLAVGTPTELAKLEAVLGDVVIDPMTDPGGKVTTDQLVVSQPDVTSRTLRDLQVWERYGVVVTRVRREGVELAPRGDLRLDMGDVLRVVGARADISALAAVIGREERRLYETSLVPYSAGIALGAVVGQIPIPLPGGISVQLGLGGGAFLVALLLGHWGNFGPVRIYVPHSVKQFTREIGLVIFLVGAGAGAGERFVPILAQTGPMLLVAGALITLVTVGVALLLMFLLMRWNPLYGAGALCACMTNPPGLAAATALADSDAAAVGFASVYPVGLISKIVFAPLVFTLLKLLSP